MYIDVVPNRKSPPAVLLRQSRRDGGKIVKTTLANLSQCPPEAVAALRLALRGVALVPHEEVFAVERSIPHGHVQAVLGVMRTVGMDALLAARPCRERALVLAMIAQRLLDPCSKLATTRVWHTTTLAQELGVADADANDLYAALDWLQQRQGRIEKKLAACPLARRGYNRDGDKLPSIVYGLLTDGAGRPIAVDVYPGNTGDPSTVPDQVEKLRMRFRRGAGRRPGHADTHADQRLARASRSGLDFRAALSGHSRAGRARRVPTLALRYAAPRRDHQRRLSRRTARGVLQPGLGRGPCTDA